MKRIQKALLLFKAEGCHLPRAAFGKALNYALGQWPAMEQYLKDDIVCHCGSMRDALSLKRELGERM